MTASPPRPRYPSHWEADVLLLDGRTARVRPTRHDDEPALVEFYEQVGDESRYLRYFAPHPQLTRAELDRMIHPDLDDEVSLVLVAEGSIIALGTYSVTLPGEAEMAFLVADAHHGRGIGALLLEHLAQVGREQGISKFVAEILPENGGMIQTLRAAGYKIRMGRAVEGYMWCEFSIQNTDGAVGVMLDREHRAEALSMQRFFDVRSAVVVGASDKVDSIGWLLVHNIIFSGFTGRVFAVNPNVDTVLGLHAYNSITEIPQDVDLAVIALPAHLVEGAVQECAAKGVRGLVVISSGFAESGEDGGRLQDELLASVRAQGLRMIGPNCLGVITTAPGISLNASLSTVMPAAGRVGFFCQSGALGVAILSTVARRGLGLSSFVSAGNRADVSGNDMLQYWEEDPNTQLVLLYLEALGNARKFSRLARRVGRHKPVIAVRSGRRIGRASSTPGFHDTSAPPEAVDALFRQSGVIQVDTLDAMFDVAQLLAYQPLPSGARVAVVGNSDGLELLAAEAAWAGGLTVVQSRSLGVTASADDYATALQQVIAAPGVDAVVVLYASVVRTPGDDVARVLVEASTSSSKPVASTFLGQEGMPAVLQVVDADGVPGPGSVPSYRTAEGAVRAMARAVDYAAWLNSPQTPLRTLENIDEDGARAMVAQLAHDHPDGVALTDEQVVQLLACYGVRLLPSRPVSTVEEAVAAGAEMGWDVVLRAADPAWRQRMDIVHARLHLDDAAQMREAWADIAAGVDDMAGAGLVVQTMATPGIPAVIRCIEDPSFGPVISFAVAGEAVDLLGDVAYRIPPLTESDVSAMVREVRAAQLFFNYRGSGWADVAALEDLVHRLSRLKDALRDVEYLELGRVLVGAAGVSVVRASARVCPSPDSRSDWYTRRLVSGEGTTQPYRP